MAQTNEFKVFQGNYIPADGAPLVIVSACPANRKLYSDYFIFIQDSEKSFYTHSMSFKKMEIPADIKLDINFMMDYALESAIAKLNDHLYQKYQKTKEKAYLYYEYKLSKTDSSALVRLYMRNQYNDHLKTMLKNKMCPGLFEVLSTIISLPKVVLENWKLNSPRFSNRELGFVVLRDCVSPH